jgi:DNA primase
MDDILLDPNLIDEEHLLLTARTMLTEAVQDIVKRKDALEWICSDDFLMALDEVSRDFYIDILAKEFKITKKTFNTKIKEVIRAAGKDKKGEDTGVVHNIPDDVEDKELAHRTGFYISKNCYWFFSKDGGDGFKASNFVVKPILHIYSKIDNKRIIEVRNEFGERKTLDLQSKAMISADLFQQSVFSEGNFIFFGTSVHHKRIVSSIGRDFPKANELRTLGWQREGFFAFSNGIFNGVWQPVDEFGVTQHLDEKYFSPAFSKIYADVREDDDEYENDRFFIYKPSPVGFAEWTDLMLKVYGPNGRMGVAFLLASIFRDYIYDRFKSFPHLFLFGEKQSGKSQMAWSLSNMFFDELPAFNLSSGTQVGFFRRLSRVKNAICWFDEYTNDIDEKRFQSLKAAYDGMGHEKGRMSRDNRTDTTKVNSACLISGQYLPTRDDNALLTRSVLLVFEKKNYKKQQIIHYDQLKDLESKGMQSLITEVLKHREILEREYTKTFAMEFDFIKNTMDERKLQFTERIARNYAYLLSVLKVVIENKLLPIPFSYDKFMDDCIGAIDEQTKQVSNSEAVSTFWHMIQFMLDSKMIASGEDFKIATTQGKPMRMKDKHEKWVEMPFTDPVKLIYFRFSKIHPLYMEAHRKQYGKNGIDMVSMLHYIKYHKGIRGPHRIHPLRECKHIGVCV